MDLLPTDLIALAQYEVFALIVLGAGTLLLVGVLLIVARAIVDLHRSVDYSLWKIAKSIEKLIPPSHSS